MKKKILLFLLVFFTIMFGLGISFMEYNMLSPLINLILTGVGLLGIIALVLLILKK